MLVLELSDRQRQILRRLVEEYIATGQPVGSKHLVERAGLPVSPSTVRAELAELERLGLLTHPHTSAGRVPTEAGYRLFVHGLLDRLEPRPGALSIDLAGTEVESALQATTEALSHVTRLLALVSAPPFEGATVRHVEVLALQPRVVVAVVITSTGDVTKRVFALGQPVDPGLVKWASDYLNERTGGVPLGSLGLRQAFTEPGLSEAERAFLELLRPAFADAAGSDEQRLYVGGAANLLGEAEARSEDLFTYRPLLAALEQRASLLALLGDALAQDGPFVRLGVELEHPGLRQASLVGASYGLAHRRLGAVSLLGPLRMDYEKAIDSVRAAARDLSHFVEEIYAEN